MRQFLTPAGSPLLLQTRECHVDGDIINADDDDDDDGEEGKSVISHGSSFSPPSQQSYDMIAFLTRSLRCALGANLLVCVRSKIRSISSKVRDKLYFGAV